MRGYVDRPGLFELLGRVRDPLALLIAAISLVFSVYNFWLANQQPELWLGMPGLVRVSDRPDNTVWMYLQPTFVKTGPSQRSAVIGQMQVSVQPAGGGPSTIFRWTERGNFAYDAAAATMQFTWNWQADAGPLLVTQDQPQVPLCRFVGPPGWQFQPGKYLVTLEASPALGGKPLDHTIEISLEDSDLQQLDQGRGRLFYVFDATPVD